MRADVNQLQDRVCIVTGAARGIGRGIAERFIDEGAKVWICDLDRVAVDATVSELAARGHIRGTVTDVTSRPQVEAMVEAAEATWGRVEVLVNNAGIAVSTPLLEIDDADWERVLRTNLYGTFVCLQVAGRAMSEAGGGVIINIASTNGLRGQPLLAHYGASKAGIINLTQTAALELGKYAIRVNAICPATTWTALSASVGWPEDVWNDLRAHAALGRLGAVEDVAAAAVYLASNESAFVTGISLPVDGGLLARQVMIEPERLLPEQRLE